MTDGALGMPGKDRWRVTNRLIRLIRLGLRGTAGKAHLFAFGLSLVVASVASTAAPLFYRKVVDDGLVLLRGDVALGWTLAGLAATLIGTACTALGGWFGSLVSIEITYQLRCEVFQSMVRRPIEFFAQSKAGELVGRISGDAADAQSLIQVVLGTLVGQGLTFALAFSAMVYLDPVAAVVALVAAPILLAPLRPFGRRLHEAGNRQAESRSRLNHHMTEQLNVLAALGRDVLGTHDSVVSGFRRTAADIRAAAQLRNVNFYGSSFLLASLGGLGVTSVYAVASLRVGGVAVSIGDVVALAGLVGLMYQPLTQIAMQGIGLVPALVAVDRVFEVIDFEPHRAAGHLEVKGPVTSVKFDRVWFRHAGPSATVPSLRSGTSEPGEEDWTVHDVSLELRPGVTALVGVTGSGKTTLAMLAAGVYHPSRGRITINDQDISELAPESRNGAVGVLTQDAFILHASIRDNLLLYRNDAADADLFEALQRVQLSDMIERMPDGLGTILGDRGYRLSGGERQRLAMARVLLGSPDVFIMDEATAHLDSRTERAISSAVADLSPNVIRLVIAHRLSTIRAADQIVVMDQGRVVERGRHKELVALGGRYAELVYADRHVGADQ